MVFPHRRHNSKESNTVWWWDSWDARSVRYRCGASTCTQRECGEAWQYWCRDSKLSGRAHDPLHDL